MKAEKRFAGGNSILVAYTHAKLISDTDTITGWLEGGDGGIQNWNNLQNEKSLASFDVPDRLVVSYVLDVPVGKGRRYITNANRFTDAAIGGWGMEGVTTIQEGFPLHLGVNSSNLNAFNSGGQRPNVIPGCNLSCPDCQSTDQRVFQHRCFTQPAPFTFGDESRNDPVLRAPGQANWDFSAFKSFAFSPEGKARLQFRAEFFNIFNRVQFGYPGQSLGSATSVRSLALRIRRGWCSSL